MTTAKSKRRMAVKVAFDLKRATPQQLDGNGALMVPFTATMTDQQLALELLVDVADGRPICTSYRVERTDGGDLALMTTEVMRGLPLRTLMTHACAMAALGQSDDGGFESATSVDAIEAVLGPLRRRRAPVTDDRLREVAAAYREHYEPGRMAEFAPLINAGERQAWRLIKLARDRGFLDRDGDH